MPSQVRAKAAAGDIRSPGFPTPAAATNSTARQLLGGNERAGVRHSAGGTRADSNIPLPSGSIAPVSAPLEPLNLSETVKDIAALAFTFLFLGTTGVLFAASMFILFFVQT